MYSLISNPITLDRCRTGDIRLVGGQTEMEGRVEMCINYIWGTVCDNQWSPAHTKVVCRYMGFSEIDGKIVIMNTRISILILLAIKVCATFYVIYIT